jgi:hypothetical protein
MRQLLVVLNLYGADAFGNKSKPKASQNLGMLRKAGEYRNGEEN